jgi:hypothetical protein
VRRFLRLTRQILAMEMGEMRIQYGFEDGNQERWGSFV